MKLVWCTEAWNDYLHWQANDHDMVEKINILIRDVKRDPFNPSLTFPQALFGNLVDF